MLFLREAHHVVGARQDEHAALLRHEWAPFLETSGLGRLLWYLDQAHGAGPAYTVVVISAIRDGTAWEEIVRRIDAGDLSGWSRRLDDTCHRAAGSLLLPVQWSPFDPVSVDDITDGRSRSDGASLFMEDTVQPHPGLRDQYLDAAGRDYATRLGRRGMLELVGAFATGFGSGHGHEVVLLQRVVDRQRLLGLLTGESTMAPDPDAKAWMEQALHLRDRWRSRLLRCATWSPLQ